MKRTPKRRQLSGIEELCSEVRPEDGVSPKVLARQRKRRRAKPNHHVFQLCKQVRQAIDAAILCDCGDPLFDDLTACWVTPVNGDSSHLLVSFGIRDPDPSKIERVYLRLNEVSGLIRTAVADSICRKRVPQLRFEILPVD